MAVLKHITSKNADYGASQRYLIFQHDEHTGKPILDENGNFVLREEYYLDGINCDPFTFDTECKELNARFHKNQNYNEIKSHQYIISFDPKDREESGLTGERAQQLGLEYAKKNFPGHQTLVCTHTDGHNGSGNIHVHIIINSLRKFDTERQDFMKRSCDSRAGYKHHLTNDYLVHLKQSLMDMCRRENLRQVDLLNPAEKKITEREYRAKRRGQEKLDQLNKQIIADGVTPRKTNFQTQKQFLRDAIDEASQEARTQEEFQKILLEKYCITVKESRGRFSYLHPERNKVITGRALGTHYEKEYLLQLISENARTENMVSDKVSAEPGNSESPDDSRSHDDGIAVLFIKSNLRLVTDLQSCAKARQNHFYAQKVKLSNLKEMAKTVAYIQEHGYDTRDSLNQSFASIKEQAALSRKALKATEEHLREINEQIHYTGQYLANKSVYSEFCSSKDKGKFRKEHSSEITLYETSRKFLKEKSDDGCLPSMKLLKEKKAELLKQKKAEQEQYHYYRDYQKELHTVCSNVNIILGKEPPSQTVSEKGSPSLNGSST